jgi:hypothetical protein
MVEGHTEGLTLHDRLGGEGQGMKELVVHSVDISHYRLVDLVRLACQAEPFYDWVERRAKRALASHLSLHDILMGCSKGELRSIVHSCYFDDRDEKPLLFDGIGRVYPHHKACFYFFAWMIRDAPQQRLSPLISRMRKSDKVEKKVAEIDSLVELFFEYRSIVKSFEWRAIKEIVIDRLEGSRRSISGHNLEASVRIGFATAIQTYFAINSNYGVFKRVATAGKQVKIGRHTIDLSVDMTLKNGDTMRLLVPIKTRETEGGGHSHLFTRDVVAAIDDITFKERSVKFALIIVAENWSPSELRSIQDKIGIVFHFNMNPNRFHGFDEKSQIALNKYIENLFLGKEHETIQ